MYVLPDKVNVGGSLTGFTVTLKLLEYDNEPSEAVTVKVDSPDILLKGETLRV